MPPLTIAQVTPYTWGTDNDVNRQIERTSHELARRGHRVAIVAPGGSQTDVRETRRRLREGRVWESGGPEVLAVSESLANTTGRRAALPVDVTRAIEALFEAVSFDVVHVHEPWAPSVASVALRYSPYLNVGTFHAPTERVVSTQVARKLVQLVFGRIDARITSFEATAALMRRFFPGDYRVVLPAADAIERADGDAGRVRLLFVDQEERAALRLFLRALRRLDPELPWDATVISARGPSSSTPLRSELRARITFAEDGIDEALAAADVLVAASDGADPAPGIVVRAVAAGVVPLVSRLAVYEEVVDDRGLEFQNGESEVLAGQLERLITDAPLRHRLREQAGDLRGHLTWKRVTDDLESTYRALVARRHPTKGNAAIASRLRRRELIDVDLHMHTDHSHDCATPVEVLLATARDVGLGAIAVTDHNEISGALDAAAKAEQFGVKVIVAEEVKTASQGEVIGLFLEEKIPRGLTLEETVAEIKRQGGLVYVPHPFDRMHAVPDYEHLLTILDDVDAIEVYNPRVAIGSFNEEAERFARKYRIVAGAGSDSHVAQGLGSVRIRMHDFDGPEEFLESLRTAEITTKPSSLLYVQALKFLETKATPAGARRARRERRVRRATRKA